MIMLDSDHGQWLFDRGQFGAAPGLAAVVISTDVAAARIDHDSLARAIDAQLRRRAPDLPGPLWSQTIAERRATYACTAGLARPAPGALERRLYLGGASTHADIPPPLEGTA